MSKLQELKSILAHHLGLSDECSDGTYLYHLTRTKSAFGLGTMTMDDFEEVDEELLNDIYEDIKPLFDQQEKVIDQLANTAGRLNQYLQKYPGGWGKNVADVAIDVMEKQQKEIDELKKVGSFFESGYRQYEEENIQLHKEIERLDNEMDGLLTIVEDKNTKAHDLFIELKQENFQQRKVLKEIASEDGWETVDEARNIARQALRMSK